jgi:polysaccharide deacetylase family protein (PEP-CTERM system associated)
MKNLLSVDVEEWFHPESVQHLFDRDMWPGYESRVRINVNKLLALFEKKGVKATFFILGWVAEKYPEMVKEISGLGHEVASHGYSHRMVTKMNEIEFQNDLLKSVKILEDITGKKVTGFRAPTFSVVMSTSWALQIMATNGFRYDSSVYPIYHDRYGIPDAPRTPYFPLGEDENLVEFPMSTVKMFGKNFPFGGGGYLRIFPLWFTKKLLRKLNREGLSGILYVHPWEFDAEQPRLDLGFPSNLRHYYNIKSNLDKLESLLTDFEWTNFESVLREQYSVV